LASLWLLISVRVAERGGDLQMLQWTAAGAGSRFAILANHTGSAGALGKQDWNRIYAFEAGK
jgi:hypothetical protein